MLIPLQKFWVLETVARIPYFAYISILHLYESIGFWRAGAELRKIHFAEVGGGLADCVDRCGICPQSLSVLGGDSCRFIDVDSSCLYALVASFHDDCCRGGMSIVSPSGQE